MSTTPDVGRAVALPSGTEVPDGLGDVAACLLDRLGHTRADLEDLVRIPSISAPGHDPSALEASAERTATLLREAGLDDVDLERVDGSPPFVVGRLSAPPGAPTVLLYAHHDVQPVEPRAAWTSDPFEPVERAGRLFGRGAADDKAGIMVHVAAVRAWVDARGRPPVGVTVVIDGEEEVGSPHGPAFVAARPTWFDVDVVVVADLVNWDTGWPALTYSLRGLGTVTLTVRTADRPLHAGSFGGPVPDAVTATARLLATLHDDRGGIAVTGFLDDVREPTAAERASFAALDLDDDRLRVDTGMRPGVAWTGDPTLTLVERLWMQPTITPTGFDAPRVDTGGTVLVPEVRVRLSCRLAPGQDPDRALTALCRHLETHAPWGAEVTTEVGPAAAAVVTAPHGPAWEAAVAATTAAFGRAPAAIGQGGSIPIVSTLRAAADVPCLLTGVEDPTTNAHGPDESLPLTDFVRSCLAEAFLFDALAERAAGLHGDGGRPS